MTRDINKARPGKSAQGAVISGNKILLNNAIDLTGGKSWSKAGYVVSHLFEEDIFTRFEAQTRTQLIRLWRESGLSVPNDFQLDQYHILASTQASHLAAVAKTKLISIANFPIPIKLMEDRIGELCNVPLMAKNPFDRQSVFHFRVVRPHSQDNNPLHRDVWLADYADCINLYIPVAGSNECSSLTLIPGSHHWPENKTTRTKEGAIIDGIQYNVPAVTEIREPYEIVRPNPGRNEVLVFSPYLIHGGAVNLNPAQTRISMELRLWKKN